MNPAIESDLPRFEETVPGFAAYLLIAGQKHPRLILGAPAGGDNVTEMRSTIRLRVTQHYTAALLGYGVPVDTPELRWATEWFATPFPRSSGGGMDASEMTRLEGLLNLRPQDAGVEARLHQLVQQRSGNYFELDRSDDQPEPNSKVFDTLWALKLLMLARQKRQFDSISRKELRQLLTTMLEVADLDKDVTLALRLQYELLGRLDASHKKRVQELVRQAEAHQYVWGLDDLAYEQMKDLIEAMDKRQLTPAVLDDHGDLFREMVLNMCYVVENLAPLRQVMPELRAPLRQTMRLWWRQFQGKQAPVYLRTLFPHDYDYLMVMCRTLVAISAYVDEPLNSLCWLPTLRRMSDDFNTAEWEEKENVERALRQWIEIELGSPTHLRLGLSEANVVRISPEIYNPTDSKRTNLLRTSLIVKYGPIDQIERERQAHSNLPARIRGMFVNIPPDSYTDTANQRAFVIMQDLTHYETLYESFDRLLKGNPGRFTERLGSFLMDMHRGDREATEFCGVNHLRELYLLPMLQHLNFIAAHMQNRDVASPEDTDRFELIEQQMNELLALVMQHRRRLQPFPLAYMHGDLHSRNIMIRPRQKSGGGNGRQAEYEFRLIDLENLRPDGDAVHDAGQLFVDLDLLRLTTNKRSLNRNIYEQVEQLRDTLVQVYADVAAGQGDDTFAIRLELAKARAQVRIAKGHAKRSGEHLKRGEYKQAGATLTDILHLTEGAVHYLQDVYRQICP